MVHGFLAWDWAGGGRLHSAPRGLRSVTDTRSLLTWEGHSNHFSHELCSAGAAAIDMVPSVPACNRPAPQSAPAPAIPKTRSVWAA